MRFFGALSALQPLAQRIPPPSGELCLHCGEPIAEDDSGVVMPLIAKRGPQVAVFHEECHLRSIVGSVKHQRGECGCVSGVFSVDDDADYPSKREAARASARELERRSGDARPPA